MASHQTGPGFLNTSPARDSTNPSTGAELTANPWTIHERCQWRTPEYHNQECYRFFDCPSHRVARSVSAEANDLDGETLVVPPSMDRINTAVSGRYDDARGPEVTGTALRGQSHQDSIAITTDPSRSSPHFAVTLEANNGAGPARFYPTPPLRSSSITNRIHPSSQQGHVQQSASGTGSDGSDWDQPSSSSGGRAMTGSPARRDSRRSSPEGMSLAQALERLSMGGGRLDGQGSSRRHLVGASQNQNHRGESTEIVLPRWQPDAEVTYCPICQAQFNIFVRKHHCRKCGRVVCNSCSPHRIIIPHQFIVRPPGSEVPLPQSLLVDALNGGFLGADGVSGGERVRLCNPCVPDPNTAPPQSPTTTPAAAAGISPRSQRSTRHRSRSSLGGPVPPPVSRYGDFFSRGQGSEQFQQLYAAASRNINNMDSTPSRPGPSSSRRRTTATHQPSLDQLLALGPSSSSLGALHYGSRHLVGPEASSSSRQRAQILRPQVAEEDECPICHLELPSRSLPNFENLREAHITDCIQSHSAYGSPRPRAAGHTPPAAPRRTGMYTYAATEKDCVDDAECTICLEEFVVGAPMARLECLCRFHRTCISAWFVNHPGRCPVHQHDGFGY